MARAASQAKKGFYSTPPHLLSLIAAYFRVLDPEDTRILDPCAGEGEALDLLGQHLGLQRHLLFANELDETRAQACSRRGLVAVCGDATEELDAPFGGFSLLYLNPPYDFEGNGEGRTEDKFLRSTLPLLCQNGILIFVVQLAVLRRPEFRKSIPLLLKDICMFRFPDSDFEAFGQCVLIGRKARGESKVETARFEAEIYTHRVLGEDVQLAPWIVPGAPVRRQHFSFFSRNLTAALTADLLASPVAQKALAMGLTRSTDRTLRSLMPLRAGHLAVTLATGVMDGAYRDPETGNILIVAGETKIKRTETDTLDEDGTEITRIRKTPQAVVKALDVTESSQVGELVLYEME
ncbi:hypothetical protein DA2_0665 [Desulfovibrio sp. A2]|nr:hypothetical protein DA2_0665 [Desulfovibrio sp. A2]